MKVYSVESKSLFFVKFLDFKIKVFSPRELFYSLIGIWILVSAIQGNIFEIFALLGIVIFIFGYLPYKFLPIEIQLINLLRFHLYNNHSQKKLKKESSSLLGSGESFSPIIDDDVTDTPKDTGPEIITIPNLEEPYTITLQTSTVQKFLPVSIYIDDMLLSNSATDRQGNVSCTTLIDTYGVKRFVVKDEKNNILYDKKVKFIP